MGACCYGQWWKKGVSGSAWIQHNSKASVGKKCLLLSRHYWLIRHAEQIWELNSDCKPKSYRAFKYKNKSQKPHLWFSFLFFAVVCCCFVKLQFHFPPFRIQGQGILLGTFLCCTLFRSHLWLYLSLGGGGQLALHSCQSRPQACRPQRHTLQ